MNFASQENRIVARDCTFCAPLGITIVGNIYIVAHCRSACVPAFMALYCNIRAFAILLVGAICDLYAEGNYDWKEIFRLAG